MTEPDAGHDDLMRLARIREIFDNALELEGGARSAYLDEACGGDAELRREVEDFLGAYHRSPGTWENPVADLLLGVLRESGSSLKEGTRIGRYEIIRQIGYGGMGAVYEAIRADDQFRKHVAIKFLRSGIEGDHAIRRFRRERQILANLNHRNITSLLDGGVTHDGQPYIVMEYVDGQPITTWCDQRRLGLPERLLLLRQVCGAVQHAHQKLVVHRDLKPGNILVTEDGTVKLLDFGIAQLLQTDTMEGELPVTQGSMRAYTPEYASPEQVRGESVLTASDIYSLGVVSCELLTRHRPFDFKSLNTSQTMETILYKEPPVPSMLLTDADVEMLGARSLPRLVRRVTGDLDAIVLQALRKEPERRYSTVEQMNRDFQRYSDGLPVSARIDGLGYRIGKFIRRHKFESIVSGAFLVSVLGGTITSVRAANQAEIARNRAEVERAKTDQVNEFLVGMLSSADPRESGSNVTVAEVLHKAAASVAEADLDPELEAQIRHTLAQTFQSLGLNREAGEHAERAYRLRLGIYGDTDQRTSYSLSYVAGAAEARGDFVVAESIARVNLEMQRKMPVIDPPSLATTLDNLARMIEHQGRLADAMPIKEEALSLRRAQKDTADMEDISYTLANLAVSYLYLENFTKAESLAREGLDNTAQHRGVESFEYGIMLRTLTSVLNEQKRFEAADSTIRQSRDILARVAGVQHAEYVRTVAQLAELRYTMGDMEGAVAAGQEVVSRIGDTFHESESSAATSLRVLGMALDSLRRYDEGGEALYRSLEIRRKYLPAEHWAIASSESYWGRHLGIVGRNAEAETLLLRAYVRLADARGESAAVTKLTARWIEQFMTKQGRHKEAAIWRARAE